MRMLDRSRETSVADVINDALEEAGYSPAEAIPGLVVAIADQAELLEDPPQALRVCEDARTSTIQRGGAVNEVR
jgi:hypothetical protein